MSATSNLFEASLGPSTELHEAQELVHTPPNCGSLEPRWWVVDIGVRARVLEAAAAPVVRPGPAEFRGPEFSDHAPLHFRVDAGIVDRHTGSERTWWIDARSTTAFVYASVINLTLLGPKGVRAYASGGEPAEAGPRLVFAQIRAGVWPCDLPSRPRRASSCSFRVRVPAGDDQVAVPIPPGARTLTIYAPDRRPSAWSWRLGSERVADIPLRDGQSDRCAVPSCTHVGPASPHREDRDALLVFGVDL